MNHFHVYHTRILLKLLENYVYIETMNFHQIYVLLAMIMTTKDIPLLLQLVFNIRTT